MPTDAPRELYDPDAAARAVAHLADDFECLEEVVRKGFAILAAALGKENGGEGDLAVFIAFHQLLEMLDGSAALMRSGRGVAARPLIRSVFESSLGLEYLLESETDFAQRGRAFLVDHFRRELRSLDMLTPGTPERAVFEEARRQESAAADWTPPEFPPEWIAGERKRLDAIVALPRWRAASDEWMREYDQRLKRKQPPSWYTLHGGPGGVKSLARHLRRSLQYLLAYMDWSRTVHGLDVGRIFNPAARAATFARVPNDAETSRLLSWAIGYGLKAVYSIGESYTDTRESLKTWYVASVGERFRRVYSRHGADRPPWERPPGGPQEG